MCYKLAIIHMLFYINLHTGLHFWVGFDLCWFYRHPLQWHLIRAVNPPCLQILRIDRKGMIDDVISHGIWRHLCKKYTLTRSSWICNVSHYCLYYNEIIYDTGVYEETFDVTSNVEYLKVYSCKVESTTKWQDFENIQEILYSNLESWRFGPKSGVSWIICQSFQHCLIGKIWVRVQRKSVLQPAIRANCS